MCDKPKTDIGELLKSPKNGKYLKVVARKLLNVNKLISNCNILHYF
jgi:hypothetical protein